MMHTCARTRWAGSREGRPPSAPNDARHTRPVPMGELIAPIVARAARLQPPSRRNPVAFYEGEGELVDALHALSDQARRHR